MFHNAGTLRKSAGAGTNSIDSHLAFINHGTVELQQGGLQFPNGFNSSGTFDLAANTVVNLDGGTFTFGTTSLKTGAGQLLVDGGDVVLNGTVPGLAGRAGAWWAAALPWRTNGVMASAGRPTSCSCASTFNNAGTVTWSGSGQLTRRGGRLRPKRAHHQPGGRAV